MHNREFSYHCPDCQWDACNECYLKEQKNWNEKQVQAAFRFEQEEAMHIQEKMPKEQQEKLQIKQDDLTDYIDIVLHLENMDNMQNGSALGQNQLDKSIFRVHVEEKVSKILDYLKLCGVSASTEIMSQGRVI